MPKYAITTTYRGVHPPTDIFEFILGCGTSKYNINGCNKSQKKNIMDGIINNTEFIVDDQLDNIHIVRQLFVQNKDIDVFHDRIDNLYTIQCARTLELESAAIIKDVIKYTGNDALFTSDIKRIHQKDIDAHSLDLIKRLDTMMDPSNEQHLISSDDADDPNIMIRLSVIFISMLSVLYCFFPEYLVIIFISLVTSFMSFFITLRFID
jgi:hypothetical protein